MEVRTRRRSGTKVKRVNIYLTQETYGQIEQIAVLRGIENGAAARELLQERIRELTGGKSQPVAVPA